MAVYPAAVHLAAVHPAAVHSAPLALKRRGWLAFCLYLALKGDGYGDNAPIELWEGDIHGRIERIEPTSRYLPALVTCPARDSLQNRHIKRL